MKFSTAIIFVLLLLVGGCGKPPVVPPAIGVGIFLPLSGPQEAIGRATLNGAELAVAQINAGGGIMNLPMKLIVKDSHAKGSASAVREFAAEKKVVAVIGDIASESSLNAAPVAVELGLPMISPGSTHPDVTKAGGWVFRVCYVDPFPARVMAKFARSLGVTSAAVLFDPGSAYGKALADGFERDFLAAGGMTCAQETYVAGTGNFTTHLEAIKAKRPEIIFLPAYFSEAAAIIKQARPLGIDVPFIGTDGWESEEFLNAGGEAVNNCYFASHFSECDGAGRSRTFAESYRAMFQLQPTALSALGFDAVGFLAAGIRNAGSVDPIALRTALAATKDFPGVTGNITLDAERNPAKSATILRVEDGQFSYLETVAP